MPAPGEKRGGKLKRRAAKGVAYLDENKVCARKRGRSIFSGGADGGARRVVIPKILGRKKLLSVVQSSTETID